MTHLKTSEKSQKEEPSSSEKTQNQEGTMFSMRIEKRILDIIDDVSKKRGGDRSTFIREIILHELAKLGFLTEEEEKALGEKKLEPQEIKDNERS